MTTLAIHEGLPCVCSEDDCEECYQSRLELQRSSDRLHAERMATLEVAHGKEIWLGILYNPADPLCKEIQDED